MSLKTWFERNFPAYSDYPSVANIALNRVEQNKQASRQRVGMVPPSRDEFAAWRADPTTRFLMAALIRNADECGDHWHNLSWVGGTADQRTLDGLRERADTLRGIAEADYDALCEVLGLEPEKEERAA